MTVPGSYKVADVHWRDLTDFHNPVREQEAIQQIKQWPYFGRSRLTWRIEDKPTLLPRLCGLAWAGLIFS
jgi:hypothetical protein